MSRRVIASLLFLLLTNTACDANSSDTSLDPGSRYLVISHFRYGRFGNNRQSLIEALGLANFTGRTLVAPPLGGCPHGELHALFDTRGAGIVERARLRNLRSLCGANGTAVMPHLPLGPLRHDGVVWRVVDPITHYPMTTDDVAPELRRFVTRTGLAGAPPYTPHFPRAYAAGDIRGFMTDPLLPLRLQRETTATCLMVQSSYLSVNWALMGPSFARATAALRPSPALEARVAAWFADNRIAQHAAVGVHLRIGEGKQALAREHAAGLARDCEAHPQFVVRNVSRLRASLPPAARGLPLLVASDAFASRCARAVLAAFPRNVRAPAVPRGVVRGGRVRAGGAGAHGRVRGQRHLVPERACAGEARSDPSARSG